LLFKLKTSRAILATIATMSLLGAAIHPEATLRSSVSSVQAGGNMPLEGAEFLPAQKVILALQGAFNEYDLPEVQASEGGTFSVQMQIPSQARPGAYRLVAIADDGDVVASLDLTIEPAAAGGMGMAEMDHSGAAAGAAMMGGMAVAARADDLPIERSRSGMEWGVIGLLIGLGAGFGVALLWAGGGSGLAGESRG